MRRSRWAAPLIVMAAGAVLTAGCSSGGGQPAAGHASPPATPRPGASSSAIPTGTQLGKLLAAAKLPSGWKHAQGEGNGLQNSGPVNATLDGPAPVEYSCKYLDASLQAGYIIGWWASSYASMVLTYPGQAGNLPEVNLTVGAYPAGDAAKNMAKAAALMAQCRSFRDSGMSGARDTTRVTTVPRLGDQNLFLTSTEHTRTDTLTGQLLLVRTGNYVVGVTNGLSAVRPATIQGFAGWLVQLLQAKSLT